jgi:hypothetical protein
LLNILLHFLRQERLVRAGVKMNDIS